MANKTETIQVRLTTSEKRKIEQVAKRQGMTTAVWVRLVLLNANLRDLLEATKEPRRVP